MKRLAFHLFGYPRIDLDEQTLKLDRRKTLALLAYLAAGGSAQPTKAEEQAESGRFSREAVSTLLWPNCSQEQAVAYLRQSLWDFTKAAGEGWIDREGSVLRLGHAEDVWVDVTVFEARLREAKDAIQVELMENALVDAVKLYTADFLSGFTLRDSTAFDEWQSLRSEGLRMKLGEALETLLKRSSANNSFEDGAAYAQRWLGLDPLNETAHRALMILYSQNGQKAAALMQYEKCSKILQDELGVSPEEATTALALQIRASRPTQESAAPRQARVRTSIPVSLPRQASQFVGREAELAQVRARLQNPDCRMLTLTGPGGSGKTRLAIQAAGQFSGFPYHIQFPHGIYFCGLASTRSEGIIFAIGQGVNYSFRVPAGQPLTEDMGRSQLFQFLADKEMLVVLDNMEHLAGCAGFLSDLLAAAPGVRILATSRARLALPEEWVIELGGLPYPLNEAGESIRTYAAVQLYLQTAEKLAGFQPADADWPGVARICRLVVGMPLAIQMAAGWSRLLSCEEIADEISRNLDFLEVSFPGLIDSHRSLRAVFERSWSLLNEADQDVFCKLSVFQSGFTREAAGVVTGASLRTLAVLADQSLIRHVSSKRFDVHELLKQYAFEKLRSVPGMEREVEERFAGYYSAWVANNFKQMKGPAQPEAASGLWADLANLERAWQWLVDHQRFQQLEKILPAVIFLYDLYGINTERQMMTRRFDEIIPRLRAALDTGPGEAEYETIAGCLGLSLAGSRRLTMITSQYEEFNSIQLESVRLARSIPNNATKGYALILAAFGPGGFEPDGLIQICREGVEVFEELADSFGTGLAYLILGDMENYIHRDRPAARLAYENSLLRFASSGSEWGKALCYFGLADVERIEGDFQAARQYFRQALELFEQVHNSSRAMLCRHCLGELAEQAGELEDARQYYETNLAYFQQIGDNQAREEYREKLKNL